MVLLRLKDEEKKVRDEEMAEVREDKAFCRMMGYKYQISVYGFVASANGEERAVRTELFLRALPERDEFMRIMGEFTKMKPYPLLSVWYWNPKAKRLEPARLARKVNERFSALLEDVLVARELL